MTRLKLMGLTAIMALAASNIVTGAPLLAIWVGSRIVSTGQISMLAVGVIALTLFLACLVLIWVLGTAGAAHDALVGRTQTVRGHVPWLRSMRGERIEHQRARIELTMLERVLVVVVVLAVLGFEVWWFIADPSPIAPGPSKD